MFVLETVKRSVEKLTGRARPSRWDLQALVRQRKPNLFSFRDDGLTPNNAKLPLVIYRGVVRLPESLDPAAVFEELFASNGWQDSWRDGIYDFSHYHWLRPRGNAPSPGALASLGLRPLPARGER